MSSETPTPNSAGDFSSASGATAPKLRGWLPHVVLIALAFTMIGVAKAKHLTTDAAMEVAFDPSAEPDDRIWAMHVAANRATAVDPRLGIELVESFLQSDSDKVRESALLIDLCRHAIRDPQALEGAPPPLQEAYAYSPLPGGLWAPHRIRCLIFHRRKVGGSGVGGNRRMELPEIQWFLDSLAGNPMPTAKEVSKYFTMRVRKAAALNTQPAGSTTDSNR